MLAESGVQPLIVGSAAEIKRRAAGDAPMVAFYLFHGDLIGGSAEIEAIFLGAITDEVVVYPIDQDLAEGGHRNQGDRASRCPEDRLVGGIIRPDNSGWQSQHPSWHLRYSDAAAAIADSVAAAVDQRAVPEVCSGWSGTAEVVNQAVTGDLCTGVVSGRMTDSAPGAGGL